MEVVAVWVGPVRSLVVFALPLGVVTVVRVHRDAVVAVGRGEQAEMHRIFSLDRLVETVVGVVTAVGVSGDPVRTLLSLGIRVMQVVGASRVDLQVREGRGQSAAVGWRWAGGANAADVSCCTRQGDGGPGGNATSAGAAGAAGANAARDLYLPLITMLLTGGRGGGGGTSNQSTSSWSCLCCLGDAGGGGGSGAGG
jgi:hypothetical protein